MTTTKPLIGYVRVSTATQGRSGLGYWMRSGKHLPGSLRRKASSL